MTKIFNFSILSCIIATFLFLLTGCGDSKQTKAVQKQNKNGLRAERKERREKALAIGRKNATDAVSRVDKTLAEFGFLKEFLTATLKKNDELSVKHSAPAEEKRKQAEEDKKKTEDALKAKREELATLEDTPENKEKREALSKDIRTLEGTLATQVQEEQKLGTQAKSSALVGDLFKQLRNDASGDLKGQLEAITAGEASVKELRKKLEEAAKENGIGSDAYNKIARELDIQERDLKEIRRKTGRAQAKLSGLDKAWGEGQIGGDAMIEMADQQRAAYDEAIAKELEANITALKKKRGKYVLTDEQRNLLKGRAADGSLLKASSAVISPLLQQYISGGSPQDKFRRRSNVLPAVSGSNDLFKIINFSSLLP